MAKVPDRFVKKYTQGAFTMMDIWVDTKTGVNYLAYTNGNAGGITLLLDAEGKPVVSPVDDEYGFPVTD